MTATAAPSLPESYRLLRYDTIGSTNDEAKALARAGAPEGTLVWAGEQTAGRGRRGRGWVSPPGNLYLSLILRPAVAPARAAQLGFVAALALGEGLGALCGPALEIRCKWPNDILAAGRKLAGILLESEITDSNAIDFVVIGTGTNLASRPSDAEYPATSLAEQGFPGVTPEQLLQAYVRRFDFWARTWRTKASLRYAGLGWPAPPASGRTSAYGWSGRRCSAGFSILTMTARCLSMARRAAPHRRRRGFSGRCLWLSGGGRCCSRSTPTTPTPSFAVWDGAALKGSWRTATEGKRTADEYVVWLDHLLALDGLSRGRSRAPRSPASCPRPTSISSRSAANIAEPTRWSSAIPGVMLGTRALVDRPEEVGADRLVNTVAAHDRYRGPLIVVDFGTATTLDVVDGDGNYRGGVIAPGINLSLTALHMAAAKLPSVRISRTERVIGTDTVSCMQSGIYWGYVGLVEGLVARIKSEFGAAMQVIATGGLAPLFAGATEAIDRVDPDLTLWGLRLIYGYNSKR